MMQNRGVWPLEDILVVDITYPNSPSHLCNFMLRLAAAFVHRDRGAFAWSMISDRLVPVLSIRVSLAT